MENLEKFNKCLSAHVGYSCVPIQQFGATYTYEEALKYGTLFPELNMPLGVYGKKAFGGINNARD